jgi:hypothetical protein
MWGAIAYLFEKETLINVALLFTETENSITGLNILVLKFDEDN